MPRVILALALAFALPAFADGAAIPISRYQAIPEPIPADFNQCVRVFWTEKGRNQGITKKWGRLDPPVSKSDLALLEYWRREGWGVITLCDDKAT